jgi:hypothetical protein
MRHRLARVGASRPERDALRIHLKQRQRWLLAEVDSAARAHAIRPSDSEALRAGAQAVFDSWLEVLQARLLAAGFGETTARRRALLVLAAIEGALILARSQRELGPLTAVRDELVELIG